MTKTEYFTFAEDFFAKALEISKLKNSDYTGASEDPFSNFAAVETLDISTEVGFLTRMMDKMKRIASFAKNGELQVKDESVTDTLRDLANYSCLFAGYLESKKCLSITTQANNFHDYIETAPTTSNRVESIHPSY